MMPYHLYQLHAAERPKTIAQQRAADVRLGEIAMAASGMASALARRIRAVTALHQSLWPAGQSHL